MASIAKTPLTAYTMYDKGMLVTAVALYWQASKPVTLVNPGASVKTVVAQLSQAADVPMDVLGTLQDEPLIVRLKSVPLDEAMAKIASCLNAEWHKEKDRFQLERSGVRERAEYRDHIATRAETIKKGIAKLLKAIDPDQVLDQDAYRRLIRQRNALVEGDPKGSNAWDQVRGLNRKLPASRTMARLLRMASSEAIAAIPPNRTAYFATSPTAKEIGFKGAADEVVRKLNSEHAELVDALEAVPAARTGHDSYIQYDLIYYKPFAKPVSKLILEVMRDFGPGNFRCDLAAFDEDGNAIFGGLEGFSCYVGSKAPEINPDVAFDLDDLATQFHAYFKSRNILDKNPVRVTNQMRDVLTHPEKHDPVSIVTGPGLVAAAQAMNRNLVALLDDSWLPMSFANGDKYSAKKLFAGLSVANEVDLSEAGWLKVTPDDRYDARIGRVPRQAMGDYLRFIGKNGYADLPTRYRMAAAYPFELAMTPAATAANALAPRLVGTMPSSQLAFRFYALLTDEQRASLESGGSLTPANLSEGQQSALAEWLYAQPFMRLSVPVPGTKNTFQIAAQACYTPESLAAGLGDLVLTAKPSRQPMFFHRPKGWDGLMAIDVTNLAFLRHQAANAGSEQFEPVNSFKIGSMTSINLRLSSPDKGRVDAGLSGLEVVPNAPMITYDQLPENLRNEVEKQIATFKKQPTQPTKSTVPPP